MSVVRVFINFNSVLCCIGNDILDDSMFAAPYGHLYLRLIHDMGVFGYVCCSGQSRMVFSLVVEVLWMAIFGMGSMGFSY